MKKLGLKVKSSVLGCIIGILAGVILVLTGCGASQPVQSESARVVETIDDAGNVTGVVDNITADEKAAPAMTDAAEESAAEDAGAVNESDDALETDAVDDKEVIDEIVERDIETITEAKDYLAYMSEDELKDLAVEALKNEGMDSAMAEGRLVTKGIEFELPEGFFESDEQKNMYITKRFPIDATNIIYMELPVDYTLQLMDKEYFESLVENAFLLSLEAEVNVTITEFTRTKIDGVPTFRVKAEYDLEDNHITHLMYVINGSKTYILIYTQTHDYDRMDWFEESAATIHVKK